MIEAKNLTKIFKVPTEEKSMFGAKKIDSAAVDDLSFSLKKGYPNLVEFGDTIIAFKLNKK